MLDQVKAFVFDVFGTVVDWREGVAREAAAILPLLGLDGLDPHGFADEWRDLYQPSMEACRSGGRPYVRLSVLHRETLDGLLRRHGRDPRQLPAEAVERLGGAWERLDPWPDAVAGLTRLRTRAPIATLSNANVSLMLAMARRAGLPWDAILGAELTRTYKPMPYSYLGTAELLRLAPAEICLVAAHNSDLHAARQAGFATAFIPRPTEHGPRQATDLAPEEDWDVVAPDLETLAGKLGC